MTIPSRADWGEVDPNDLDANSALQSFLGKSFAEAQEMFATNALYYQEELQSMPAAVFNYYAPALTAYLQSDKAKGDSDGASSFLAALLWTLKTQPDIMTEETRKNWMQAADFVSKNQVHFAANPEIYGVFADRFAEIQKVAIR